MMRTRCRQLLAVTTIALTLIACHDDDKAVVPPPAEPTESSIAHFCNRAVLEHPGPRDRFAGAIAAWFVQRDGAVIMQPA